MWKKWIKKLNWPKGMGSYFPAFVILVAAVIAFSRYEPVWGGDNHLSELFSQYENSTKQPGSDEGQETKTEEKGEAETFKDGVYTGTGTGYGGKITVEVTVKETKITSIEILSAPGEDASFLNKAKGVIDSIIGAQTLEVDTVSGATYSSRGILAAIKNALYGTEDTNSTAAAGSSKEAGETPTIHEPENGYADGTYTGEGTGFGGTIKVQVKIKKGKIKKIKVLEASGETPSYLKKAKKLLDTMVKKQTANVDAVSGATFTSNGIIKAVQNALKKAAKKANDADDAENTTAKKEETTENSDTAYQDGIYEGTGKGFRGNLTVKVTIKTGKITAIEVTDGGRDDKEFLDKAKGILSVMIEKQTADVDAATGATYSSKGLIEAVKSALKKAAKQTDSSEEDTEKEQETTTEREESQTTEQKEEPTTGTEHSSSQEGTTETANTKYMDGTFTGKGMGNDDYITATVTIKNDVITDISLSAASATEWLDDVRNTLTKKILQNQSVDGIDVVSGATYSSYGVLDAVAEALSKARK